MIMLRSIGQRLHLHYIRVLAQLYIGVCLNYHHTVYLHKLATEERCLEALSYRLLSTAKL